MTHFFSVILFVALAGMSQVMAQVSDQYTSKLEQKVYPFYQTGLSKFYSGVDQKSIHFREFKRGANDAVIVLPGRTEPTKKYAEVVYDLSHLDVDFFMWDPRGQGYSDRLLSDIQKGYVESYKDYITDFTTFMKNEVIGKYENVYIVAHSMGAAISLRYVQLNPGVIKKMVLSSPMLQLKTQGLPESATVGIMGFLKTIGKKRDYIPGGGPLDKPVPFSENRVTASEDRYAMAREIDAKEPELLMGSATVNWVFEAIRMTKKIFRNRKKLRSTPILMFQAGNDEFSKDRRQRVLCEQSANCTLERFEDSKHEMFQERDVIRDKVMNLTEDFIRN